MADEIKPEEAAAPPPAPEKVRRLIDVMYEVMREATDLLGNHPRLEALLEELRAKL